MNKLLIHNDNVVYKNLFEINIKFPPLENIDEVISTSIISQIKESNCDIIFIKDNLSDNYLELYGLRVIYHIRLSLELGNKRFLPIVIISDIDSYILNKLDNSAKIIFTKNIFIIKNNQQIVLEFLNRDFRNLNELEYQEFLEKIVIYPPKDYLSHHSIANEWAIDRWAKFLNLKTDSISKTNNKISSMLYFKYLQAKNPIQTKQGIVFATKEKGKILFIDDEWNKGWSDILFRIVERNKNITFETFQHSYRDIINIEELFYKITEKIKQTNPDVIILDLRLFQKEQENDIEITQFSGIKLLDKIHQINGGIQVIMLTATGKSLILEKLYEYHILGYIKKEHPNDNNINTGNNIKKLVKLIDKGLNNSYLKEIWNIQNELLKLEIFQTNNETLLELKNNISLIFIILNSNIKQKEKFKFTTLTIFKCFEIVCDYFIYEKKDNSIYFAYWKDNNQIIDNNGDKSTRNKIKSIFNKFGILSNELENEIKIMVNTRNHLIHPATTNFKNNTFIQEIEKKNILEWFGMLDKLLVKL